MRRKNSQKFPKGKYIRCEGPADFAAYYDGHIVGYRATHLEAESLLDGYVFDLLKHGKTQVGEFVAAA